MSYIIFLGQVLVKSLGFQDGAGRLQFMTDPALSSMSGFPMVSNPKLTCFFQELKLPFSAYLDAVEACERGERPMPYYLGKVPLRAELPELADEINAAKTSPQEEKGNWQQCAISIFDFHHITACATQRFFLQWTLLPVL